MRLRALIVAFSLFASIVAAPASFAKAPVSGASCSKFRLAQDYKGKRFTCIKSGKKLVWNKGVTIKTASTANPSPTPSSSSTLTPTPITTPTPTPTPSSTVVSYTMEQVKANNTSARCWSAIEGNVYDLTNWINTHPGGAGAIRSLCGIDGTQEFNRQHYGQRDPLQRLKLYLLGPLAK